MDITYVLPSQPVCTGTGVGGDLVSMVSTSSGYCLVVWLQVGSVAFWSLWWTTATHIGGVETQVWYNHKVDFVGETCCKCGRIWTTKDVMGFCRFIAVAARVTLLALDLGSLLIFHLVCRPPVEVCHSQRHAHNIAETNDLTLRSQHLHFKGRMVMSSGLTAL